jgi:hypothetical protein
MKHFGIIAAVAVIVLTAHFTFLVAAQSAQSVSTGLTQPSPDGTGLFGHTYALDGNVDISVDNAGYTLKRVYYGYKHGDLAGKDEKLLVVRYKLKNGDSSDLYYDGQSVNFTVVSPDGHEFQNDEDAGNEKTGGAAGGTLKAGQTASLFKVIHVPAQGEMPTLLVTPGPPGLPSLRYNLAGAVKPLPPPFADPADTASVTAVSTVPATVGVPYPTGGFDISVLKVAFSTEKMMPTDTGARKADSGRRFLVVTISAKCFSDDVDDLSTYAPEMFVVDTAGNVTKFNGAIISPTLPRAAETIVTHGETRFFRLIFQVDKTATLKSLGITDNPDKSKTYLYGLTGMK